MKILFDVLVNWIEYVLSDSKYYSFDLDSEILSL